MDREYVKAKLKEIQIGDNSDLVEPIIFRNEDDIETIKNGIEQIKESLEEIKRLIKTFN